MLKVKVVGAAFAAAAIMGFAGTPAAARDLDAPWCLEYNGGFSGVVECGYYSLEQCLRTRLGVGGNCIENPRRAFGKRRDRKNHRDVLYGLWPPAGPQR